MPPSVNKVLPSPGQSLRLGTLGSIESRFSHDFSRVQPRSPTPAVLGASRATNGPAADSVRSLDPGGLEGRIAGLFDMKLNCPPAPDSVSVFSGVAGAGTLGFTKIDKASEIICMPKMSFDAKAGTCSVSALPVKLLTTSKFAKVEKEASAGKLDVPEKCPKPVPLFTTITPDISKLAEKGEKQHCDDLSIAFNQTLVPCEAELRKLNGQKFKAKNENDCLKAVATKLGFDPEACTEEFVAQVALTEERDIKGFHDFDPVATSSSCDKIIFENKPSKTNKIEDASVAPSKYIPAATKCARPVTKAPTPKTPPKTGAKKPDVTKPEVKKQEVKKPESKK